MLEAPAPMSARGPLANDGAVRLLRGVVVGLGGLLFVLGAWVVVARLRYPIDAEWMTGAVRDGVDRVRRGEPLYGPPSAEFVPFLYPPLYFMAAGLLARVVSTFAACKIVSLTATFATVACVFGTTRALGASRFWTLTSALLYVGMYALGLFFFDLERVDVFAAAWSVAAVFVLVSKPTAARAALSGVLAGAAFFAKQPGIFVFFGILAGLLAARERRRALAFGLAGAATMAMIGVALDVTSGGWFHHYVLELPQAHGVRPQLLSVFFVADVPKCFALSAGSVAFLASAARGLRARRDPQRAASEGDPEHRTDAPSLDRPNDVVVAGALLAAMVAAFLGRAHQGGWPNVLLSWFPFACVATAVMASRFERRADAAGLRGGVCVVLGSVALQLLGGVFDPSEVAPNADDLAERQRFIGLVRALETKGDVLVTAQGNVSTRPSVHAAALYDVLRAGEETPKDLRANIADRRYAAIVTWSPFEPGCEEAGCPELVALTTRNYFVAARRHERRHTGRVGFDAWPEWVLLPRKHPLPELSEADVVRRQRVEMALADVARAETPETSEVQPDPGIEDRAEKEWERAARDVP